MHAAFAVAVTKTSAKQFKIPNLLLPILFFITIILLFSETRNQCTYFFFAFYYTYFNKIFNRNDNFGRMRGHFCKKSKKNLIDHSKQYYQIPVIFLHQWRLATPFQMFYPLPYTSNIHHIFLQSASRNEVRFHACHHLFL